MRGVLAIALEAKKRGRQILIVPSLNAEEAAPVNGLAAYGANSLSEVVNFLRGEVPIQPVTGQPAFTSSKIDDDFAEDHGRQHGKRAVEVAAAGNHSLLKHGPFLEEAPEARSHWLADTPSNRMTPSLSRFQFRRLQRWATSSSRR